MDSALDTEILGWILVAKGGDVVGHEFHGNQHTGGIGGGGEPPRQSDPGRNQVSEDRYKSPHGEEPQNVPQTDQTVGAKPQSSAVIAPEANTPEAIKTFSENVLKRVWEGSRPIISGENYAKMLEAMADVDKGLQKACDLTELRIDGTNLMGDEGMGIPRKEMPQIDGSVDLAQSPTATGNTPEFMREDGTWDARSQFLSEIARDNGVTMEAQAVDPTELKPWQKEVDAGKIGNIFRSNPNGIPDKNRILISSDGYVIDGHHNWAAAVGLKFANPDTSLPVYRLSITGQEAIDLSNKWADDHGLQHQSLEVDLKTQKAIAKWLQPIWDLEPLTSIF
jgi:hypothetical protein